MLYLRQSKRDLLKKSQLHVCSELGRWLSANSFYRGRYFTIVETVGSPFLVYFWPVAPV